MNLLSLFLIVTTLIFSVMTYSNIDKHKIGVEYHYTTTQIDLLFESFKEVSLQEYLTNGKTTQEYLIKSYSIHSTVVELKPNIFAIDIIITSTLTPNSVTKSKRYIITL